MLCQNIIRKGVFVKRLGSHQCVALENFCHCLMCHGWIFNHEKLANELHFFLAQAESTSLTCLHPMKAMLHRVLEVAEINWQK